MCIRDRGLGGKRQCHWTRRLVKQVQPRGRRGNMGRSTVTLPSFWLDTGITGRMLERPSQQSACTACELRTPDGVSQTFFVCDKWELYRRSLQEDITQEIVEAHLEATLREGRLELCGTVHRRVCSSAEGRFRQHNGRMSSQTQE